MAPLLFLIALAASVPAANIPGICKGAREAASPERKAAAYEACIRAEQAAQAQLQERWSQFSAAAHSSCARPEAFSLSYVEMLTCLEIQTDGNIGKAQKPPASGNVLPNAVAPAMPARLGIAPNPMSAPGAAAPALPDRFKN
jgi:hypothetical protein